MHAQLLPWTVRDHLDDPAGFAGAYDERTEREMAPFYWNQIRADRLRLAQMAALREGREPVPDDSFTGLLDVAAMRNPDAFRASLEIAFCLALPQEVIERPGMREAASRSVPASPRAARGPDRQQLLRLLAQ